MILIDLFKYFIFLSSAILFMKFVAFLVLSLVTDKNTARLFLGYLWIFSRNFNPTKEEFDGLIRECEPKDSNKPKL